MPASQAGRHGFDPRLPLHKISRLGPFCLIATGSMASAFSAADFAKDRMSQLGFWPSDAMAQE
jgi:hypothetical protein